MTGMITNFVIGLFKRYWGYLAIGLALITFAFGLGFKFGVQSNSENIISLNNQLTESYQERITLISAHSKALKDAFAKFTEQQQLMATKTAELQRSNDELTTTAASIKQRLKDEEAKKRREINRVKNDISKKTSVNEAGAIHHTRTNSSCAISADRLQLYKAALGYHDHHRRNAVPTDSAGNVKNSAKTARTKAGLSESDLIAHAADYGAWCGQLEQQLTAIKQLNDEVKK